MFDGFDGGQRWEWQEEKKDWDGGGWQWEEKMVLRGKAMEVDREIVMDLSSALPLISSSTDSVWKYSDSFSKVWDIPNLRTTQTTYWLLKINLNPSS